MNLWFNAVLYFLIVIVILYGLVLLREELHPVSLLEQEIVLPAAAACEQLSIAACAA